MAHLKLHISVEFAWWWVSYVEFLNLMARISGTEPDMEEVANVVERAIQTKVWMA